MVIEIIKSHKKLDQAILHPIDFDRLMRLLGVENYGEHVFMGLTTTILFKGSLSANPCCGSEAETAE